MDAELETGFVQLAVRPVLKGCDEQPLTLELLCHLRDDAVCATKAGTASSLTVAPAFIAVDTVGFMLAFGCVIVCISNAGDMSFMFTPAGSQKTLTFPKLFDKERPLCKVSSVFGAWAHRHMLQDKAAAVRNMIELFKKHLPGQSTAPLEKTIESLPCEKANDVFADGFEDDDTSGH